MMHKIGGLRTLAFAATLVGLAGLTGCTSPGQGYQDIPLARKLSWFSYVKGEDVRARCQPGAPDTFRFVYNAVYVEQVRTYDIEPSPEPGHMRMTVRVTEKANLSEILLDPGAPDLTRPWKPKIAVVDLPATEVARLKRALLADGFLTRPAPARSVSSIEFYWAVSACIDGQFRLNAYIWPSSEFNQASFPTLLFAWDMTQVAVNKPRKTDTLDIYGTTQENDHEFVNYFKLRFDRS
jgi:hypothetical protein